MQFELPQEGLVRFENRVENVYGDYSEWEKILQILSFDDDSINEYLRGPESDLEMTYPQSNLFSQLCNKLEQTR